MIDKEQKIIKTATRLFVEKGMQASSMQLIAKESGVAVGTIYTYFKSKEDLIKVIYSSVQKDKMNYILDSEIPVEIKSRFYRLVNRVIEYMIANEINFRFLDIYFFSPLISCEIRADEYKNKHPLNKLLSEGKQQGIIKDIDNMTLFLQISGAISSLIHWSLYSKEKLGKEEIEKIVEMSWDSISIHKNNL